MAIIKLPKKGYGQLELNDVAFRRDGRIEAQSFLDATEFEKGATAVGAVAENGMLFAIDFATRTLTKATAVNAADMPVGINYSAEKLYDPNKPGLRNYFTPQGEFLPRIGMLDVTDSFHTNVICYDDDAFADEDAIADAFDAGTAIYAGIASDGSGYWELSETKPTVGPVAQVAEVATMPDGQTGIKLVVIAR